MEDNNIYDDEDFKEPDYNDETEEETKGLKSLKAPQLIGMGVGVFFIVAIMVSVLLSGKNDKKAEIDEIQTVEKDLNVDNLKKSNEEQPVDQLPALTPEEQALMNQNMANDVSPYQYLDNNLSEMQNTSEAENIDNSYASINTDVPSIYERDSINDSSYKGNGESSEAKGRKSNIGFKKEQMPNQVIPNTQTTSQNPQQGNGTELSDKDKKQLFINQSKVDSFILSNQLMASVSNYEVKAGNIIPIILMTRINSDLPNNITALVREDVYDSITGKYLLIPKGSRVFGTYDSNIAYGQDRLLMVWQRIQMPNGFSINLDSMQGVDMIGQSGVKGKVNNHTLKLLRSVVLSSLFNFASNGIKVTYNKGSSGENAKNQYVIAGNVADDTAGSIQSIGDRIVERDLNQQPTVIIKEGTKMNILVNKDMLLYPYSKLKK